MQFSYILLGRRIKNIRKKKGITQANLAESIGRSSPYISYIENGYKSMSLDTFVKIANTLDCSSDDLLQDSLENIVKVSNHEFASIISDCSEYELRVLSDVIRHTKTALRENKYFLTIHRR